MNELFCIVILMGSVQYYIQLYTGAVLVVEAVSVLCVTMQL